jgi:hypothetical protein
MEIALLLLAVLLAANVWATRRVLPADEYRARCSKWMTMRVGHPIQPAGMFTARLCRQGPRGGGFYYHLSSDPGCLANEGG